MEKASLKRPLALLLIITLAVAAALSAGTVFAALSIRQRLLDTRGIVIKSHDYKVKPGTDGSVLYGYVLEPEDYSYGELSGGNQIAYCMITVLMPVLPVCYVVLGVWFAVAFFYRTRLQKPIEALKDGIQHISDSDLDFQMGYRSKDELGRLCGIFEDMRQSLYENNQKMWDMLQEREAITASVSHDLRTPITVIRGYLDYLEQAEEKGALTRELLRTTLSAMRQSGQRLERYVDCIQDIQRLADMELEKEKWNTKELLLELERECSLLAGQQGKTFVLENRLTSEVLWLDKQMLFKILENIVGNALRFARKHITLKALEDAEYVTIAVEDDGTGFSAEGLRRATELFYSSGKKEGSFGIGLTVCKTLCEKQGGDLSIANRECGGAYVLVRFKKEDTFTKN